MDNQRELKYDVFIFYNEIDLLEIRINILYPHVDFFVIVESTKTFTGKNKPLYYQNSKQRFKKFEDKILYFIVEDCPDTFEEVQYRLETEQDQLKNRILKDCLESPQIPKDNSQSQWLREFYQKEMMKIALHSFGAKEGDICYISDVDEIWDPRIEIYPSGDKILKMEQKVYSMYLNLRSSEKWFGTYVTKYSKIKGSTLNHLDNPAVTPSEFVPNGGWHFTFQGGVDMIINKIENYGHQELNTSSIKNRILGNYQEGSDLLGRGYCYQMDEIDLPEYLIENRNRYPQYFK
jgi:beta-1,4-mannosyl-glycoprotein beta-1,4-N-acetylglucosaminyltransferase